MRPSPKLSWARRASITGHAPGFPNGAIGAQQDVIQLANGLDGLFQLLVVAEPLAHLRHLFAMDVELPGASAGIADGQDCLRMSFTASALGAAADPAEIEVRLDMSE